MIFLHSQEKKCLHVCKSIQKPCYMFVYTLSGESRTPFVIDQYQPESNGTPRNIQCPMSTNKFWCNLQIPNWWEITEEEKSNVWHLYFWIVYIYRQAHYIFQVEKVWEVSKMYPPNDVIQTLGGIMYYQHFRTVKSPQWFSDPVRIWCGTHVSVTHYSLIKNIGDHNLFENCSLSL